MLSEHVAAAAEIYLPRRSSEASAVRTCDRWFDTMNSRNKCDPKPERCAFGVSPQIERQQRHALATMEALMRGTSKLPSKKGSRESAPVPKRPRASCGKKMPFQEGILRNCRSLPGLLEDVRPLGVTYLMTARLNQDLVENCFSQLRAMCGANTHPDAVEAQTRLRMLLMAPRPIVAAGSRRASMPVAMEPTDSGPQYLTAGPANAPKPPRPLPDSQAPDSMPKDADSRQLSPGFVSNHVMETLGMQGDVPLLPNTGLEDIEIVFEDSHHVEVSTPQTPAEESLAFVAGYVAAKCRDIAPGLGTTTQEATPAELSEVPTTWTCALSRGNLTIPSASWYKQVQEMEATFREQMGARYRTGPGVKAHLRACLLSKWPAMDKRVVAKYVSTRMWQRIRTLNEKKAGHSAARRAMQQIKQHAK